MSLILKKISSPAPVERLLSEKLQAQLGQGQKVLWLIPGGSAIRIAANVAKSLEGNSHLTNLAVSLTDERYGPADHSDSNWRQLKEAGFDLKGAELFPVLGSQDIKSTARNYANWLNQKLEECDYSVALGGMGPDGHIFGIKPHSPAVKADQDIVSYKWDDYERIALTVRSFKKFDEIIVYAVGQEKWPQLGRLEDDISPEDQPAQLLKDLTHVTVYNDYKGDAV
ncbi:MAG TPA: 6-phosphogluconolactonase [Candidatus Saccharimonadales bacterium]|nr:6-phosphogluconolactonase [Candidatus Saccharimonadales bacterium]